MSAGTVAIDINAVSVVTYAMAHNRIDVINEVRLTNGGDELRAARLVAEVRDAQGRLSQPFEVLIDLPSGASLVLRDLELKLDPAAMAKVEAHRPGRLRVEVLDADGWSAAVEETDVKIHAAAHWSAEPFGLGLEMLPAHVMPNSPEVAQLLQSASQILLARTGSPSIEGYQSGSERVDEIARAVFEAMQQLDIVYTNPPASWAADDDAGQKVRTPKEVLGDRVGTCLDLAVVMAACLEQAGIHPLLWVVEGHAFVGWWRHERDLGVIAVRDLNDVINLLDLGQMSVLETTMLTMKSGGRVDFLVAVQAGRRHLDAAEEFLGCIDIRRARRNAIYPLPAQARLEDGTTQIVQYSPTEHSLPALTASGGRAAQQSAAESVPARVTAWKNSLLDLTLRNRLLKYTDRHGINLAVPSNAVGYVEDLLHAGKPIQLLPSDEVTEVARARGVRFGRDLPEEVRAELVTSKGAVYTDVTSTSYLTRLRSLSHKARTILDESGANNLYLALGSLVWDIDGAPLRSPLVLVPVKLVTAARQATYRLELDESGQSTPNYCLLEKLKQVHGMSIPGLANPVSDDSGIDLAAAFDAVRVAIAERGLSYRVEETADLAILQFAKFRLWKDLDENWETFSSNALVRHLIHTPNQPFEDTRDATGDTDLDALAALCPIPADSSQLGAIADAVSGRTFVLEGPPGTGKSQTITNLLARAMAEGRRVLFVAEKRAALDVVKSRLDAVGMGAFSLDLHDKGSKPAVVREQIREALEARPLPDRQALNVAVEQHVTSARRLSRYASRVHETNGADQSLYSATTDLLHRSPDDPAFDVPTSLLTHEAANERESLRAMLRQLPEVAVPARPAPDHPWAFVNVEALDARDLAQVQSAACTIDASLDRLASVPVLTAVLEAVSTPRELESLAKILRSPSIELDTLDRTRSPQWQSDSAAVRQEIHAFVAAAHPGLDMATPEALDLPLADIYARGQTAAASSWFGRKKRLRAVAAELEPGLRPGTVVEPKAVVELVAALVQLQGAVHHLSARSASVAGVSIPMGWNPLTPDGAQVVAQQLDWLEWAGGVVSTQAPDERFPQELRRLVDRGWRAEAATADAVEELATGLRLLLNITSADQDSLSAWTSGRGLLERWLDGASRRSSSDPELHSLRRWLDLRRTLAPLDRARMGAAKRSLLDGTVESDFALTAFEKGLSQASQRERLTSNALDVFDRTSHERSIRTYVDTGRQIREILRDTLPAEAVQRREFNSASESGRVGALRRELGKTRRGLSVRALMESYSDLVTQLMPCVLVSPDSLSRFFPARADTFDLVVFDEASQIRVADAIGAMGRARSVVVVGDSKQMPPTAFGQGSAEDDVDVDEPESEELVDGESILEECVNVGVPKHWLSWHYRSQDESLIAFSNVHYYEDRLSSFPAPRVAGSSSANGGHGVSLVRVGGTFQRSGKGKLLRTNPEEAAAIVAEITRRFDASTDAVPSIGVVTFNQQQRAHIEALIRDGSNARMIEALDSPGGEGLFVKNLENVQGDERDVIFFSTAFSVNEKGVLPLNFGPLIQAGGERRLNVAITRARRQVVVFTSFEPSQLRVDETKNKGLKHLRAYLELADAGTRALESSRLRRPNNDLHRDEVADALRDRGYVVQTDVGLSDFRVDISVARVDDPHRPVAAVLLDGPEWGARRTIGDRDALPLEVLGGMLKWPVVSRVWLPTWLDDRVKTLDDLEASFVGVQPVPQPEASMPAFASGTIGAADGRALSEASGQVESDVIAESDDVWAGVLGYAATDQSMAPTAEKAPSAFDIVYFQPWEAEMRGGRDVLDALDWSARARSEVSRAAVEIIEAEEAVHADRLVKLVASSFNLNRVNANRAASILAQVPSGHRRGDEPNVLWATSVDPGSWDVVRTDEDGTRPIEHVPLREIANAMVAVCAGAGGVTRAELLREALSHFGFRRLTQGIEARMVNALDYAVSAGLITELGGVYRKSSARDVGIAKPVATDAQPLTGPSGNLEVDYTDFDFDYTHVVISRQQIESGDTSEVLAALNVLVSAPDVAKRNRERVALSVYGYEADARELWEIDDVRDFLSQLDDEFPYWFWFLDKTQPFLKVIVLCHVDVHRVGPGKVKFESSDMQQLLTDWWLPKAVSVCSWTGGTESDADEVVERGARYAAQGPAAFAVNS